jgi:hypothetical protein
MQGLTSDDYRRKLDELDRLINDPDVPIQPALSWHLLDEVARLERLDKSSSFDGEIPILEAPLPFPHLAN